MSAKSLILSAAAYESLAAIGEWIREQFGSRQASRYEDMLIAHCQRVAAGTAHHRSCRDVFAPEAREDLRFARAGEHYVIFVATAREVMVVDFAHSRMDLPGCVEGLGAAENRLRASRKCAAETKLHSQSIVVVWIKEIQRLSAAGLRKVECHGLTTCCKFARWRVVSQVELLGGGLYSWPGAKFHKVETKPLKDSGVPVGIVVVPFKRLVPTA